MLKHIFWDWNGTLLDDAWLCVSVMNDLLEKYKMPYVSLETYKDLFGFPVKNYYSKIGFDFSKIPFEKLGVEYIDIYNKRVSESKLQKNAKLIVEKFNSLGIQQSILSAREQKQLEVDLESFGIKKYFTHISGLSNNYAAGKLENAKQLLKKIDTKPSQVLMIGDTTHDYEIAKKLGLKRIIVDIGHQSSERLKKLDVVVLDNLYSILHENKI